MLYLQMENFTTEKQREELRERLRAETGEDVFLIPAYLKMQLPRIFYECDRRACSTCHSECSQTSDIRHAKNFVVREDGTFFERRG